MERKHHLDAELLDAEIDQRIDEDLMKVRDQHAARLAEEIAENARLRARVEELEARLASRDEEFRACSRELDEMLERARRR